MNNSFLWFLAVVLFLAAAVGTVLALG